MEELVENKHILPCISLREKHPNTVLINTGNFSQKKKIKTVYVKLSLE